MKRILIFLVIITALLLIASCSTQDPLEPVRSADIGPSEQAQRWLVMLEDSAVPATLAHQLKSRGAAVDFVYTKALKGLAVRLNERAAAELLADPRVVLMEPDLPVSILAPGGVPGPPGGKDKEDDEHPPQVVPSGIDRIGADENPNTGAGTEVAILDTGIALNHADLVANILGDVNFIKPRKSGNDDNGHGTHVAGIIGAIDNDIGVVGVAPETGLWAIKVLDSQGNGWISTIVAGIDWVAANAGHIDVANMSLGAKGSSDILHIAVQGAVDAGVTMVVSAGNDYDNASFYVPASYDEVITVSGIRDTNDAFYHWSNWGTVIDLTAPGVNILSTLLGARGLPLYGTLTGTSMSAPHVAGCAALYIASNPGSTPAQVMAALEAAGYLPPGGWLDDPLVYDSHPDPDSVTEELVIAESL